ncbi:hypothetical protein BDZ45DRAFT_686859 [Acephala macrosclerotiorum]|nr:hypothetical protein BDZ45DRAFT_686859 [Acephala macrosclerotiorum]
MSKNANGKRPRERSGIGFSDDLNAKRYEMDYEDGPEIHSTQFIGLQELQQQMYEDIKKTYLIDEEKRFRQYTKGKMKNEMRREAKLDLEEDNRKVLEELKMKLKVDFAQKNKSEGEKLKKLREDLRVVKEKNKKLEELLEALGVPQVRMEGDVGADAEPSAEEEPDLNTKDGNADEEVVDHESEVDYQLGSDDESESSDEA